MTYDKRTRIHSSDKGKMLVRKSDGKTMGYSLQLGDNDTIDNYEERTFTEEEIAAFWKSVGGEDPRKPHDHRPQSRSIPNEKEDSE